MAPIAVQHSPDHQPSMTVLEGRFERTDEAPAGAP